MLTRTFRALAALAGAILLSQFPAFYDQYVQRLAGRLDQARIDFARVEEAARLENMTLDAYIEVFVGNPDSPVRRQGRIMRAQVADLRRMEAALAVLQPAPTLARPLRFARHAEPELARATFDDFRPALPLGTEGFAYALLGMLGGLLGARAGERALAAARRHGTAA